MNFAGCLREIACFVRTLWFCHHAYLSTQGGLGIDPMRPRHLCPSVPCTLWRRCRCRCRRRSAVSGRTGMRSRRGRRAWSAIRVRYAARVRTVRVLRAVPTEDWQGAGVVAGAAAAAGGDADGGARGDHGRVLRCGGERGAAVAAALVAALADPDRGGTRSWSGSTSGRSTAASTR
jgi:hypothetical protein